MLSRQDSLCTALRSSKILQQLRTIESALYIRYFRENNPSHVKNNKNMFSEPFYLYWKYIFVKYTLIYANLISTSILYWHPNVVPNLGYFSWWLEFTPRYLSLSQNKEAYITSFLSNKCWIIYKVFTLIDNWGWKLKQFPKLDHKIFHANTEQFCFIFHFQTRNLWTFAKILISTVLQ